MQADVQAATASTVDPALARVLARLAEAAELLGVDEVAHQALETAGRLQALRLEVAVVGEFKRGKSSLINALMGREVLPVGVLPLTAVPTILERARRAWWSSSPTAARSSAGSTSWPASSPRRQTRATHLDVAQVTARLHTPLLDAGVRLVDTPGVGSVYEHNTHSTHAYLPRLDAAVLITSADPPISEAERAFLERVLERAVRLFVVLNKADYLAADDLERTMAFTERVVRDVLPDWPGPVYPCRRDPGPATRRGCAGSGRTSPGSSARSGRRS